tara:strand:- start:85 stop:363 length:279 start_codon:yes stop_codon:yes gene_type:complete
MSAIKYEVGELVLVSPLIFSQSYTYEDSKILGSINDNTRYGVITEIEDTLDVWYSKQDKYKHTYTVLTTFGEVKKYFSHELEPVENAKYYAK